MRRWLVRLSGGAPMDEIGRRKIIEAPSHVDAAQIALRIYGRATSATTEGECPEGKWRACDEVKWDKGRRILAGEKWWAVL